MAKYVKVMFDNKGANYEYKIGEVNIANNWNPKATSGKDFGGFNYATEDCILRWLHRGNIIYDVEVPKDAENIKIEGATTIYRTNKIIVKNPRKVTDDMAYEFYKKANIPEKSYAKALCAVVLMGYEKTANAILKDKVNPENVDYYLEEWNDFFNFGGDGKRNTNVPLIIDIHNKLKAIKTNNVNRYITKIDSYNFSDDVKKIFEEQIRSFYNHKTHTKLPKYNVGEEVKLTNLNLIHGSRANLEELALISKSGLIASEFYNDNKTIKKKPFVVELWQVNENISLKNWLNKYTGLTVEFYDKSGLIYKRIITPIDNLKSIIKKESGYRNYIIYQNQEQRFLPNELNNNECSVSFIVKYSNNDLLIKNDIFNTHFSKKISREILPSWYFEKYIVNRDFDNNETGREKAILFGVPASMIEGIIVSDKLKENKEYLKISELFPNCYICDRNGLVLIS